MSETERLPNTVNLAFVEGLYLDYLKEPSSVPTDWRGNRLGSGFRFLRVLTISSHFC